MIEMFHADELKAYFGYDFTISEHVKIRQPTVGEIVDMGEHAYFSFVNTFLTVPSDIIAQLDKNGVDWRVVEPFELFCMLVRGIPLCDSRILFGDLDFTQFEVATLENKQCYLQHTIKGFAIDEVMYLAIKKHLCQMHCMKEHLNLKAGNEATNRTMIRVAYEDWEREKRKEPKSMLRSLISTLVNMEGFKYNSEQVKGMTLGEFMDSAQRLPMIQSARALLQGCYAGNVDMNKINKKELNYMRGFSES